MTTKRDIESRLNDLDGTDKSDGDTRIVVNETVVGSSWNGSELNEGETETETEVIDVGGGLS